MFARRWILALVALASLAGCAGANPKIMVNGVQVYESVWRQTTTELAARARFDLGCEAQFEFVLFKRVGPAPSEVGVAGCGKRATYVRSFGQYSAGPWTVNILSEPQPAAEAGK